MRITRQQLVSIIKEEISKVAPQRPRRSSDDVLNVIRKLVKEEIEKQRLSGGSSIEQLIQGEIDLAEERGDKAKADELRKNLETMQTKRATSSTGGSPQFPKPSSGGYRAASTNPKMYARQYTK